MSVQITRENGARQLFFSVMERLRLEKESQLATPMRADNDYFLPSMHRPVDKGIKSALLV